MKRQKELHKKKNGMEKFKSVSGDRQFLSVTNRINSLNNRIVETTMAKEQLFRVKERIFGLMESVDKRLVEIENGTKDTEREKNK